MSVQPSQEYIDRVNDKLKYQVGVRKDQENHLTVALGEKRLTQLERFRERRPRSVGRASEGDREAQIRDGRAETNQQISIRADRTVSGEMQVNSQILDFKLTLPAFHSPRLPSAPVSTRDIHTTLLCS